VGSPYQRVTRNGIDYVLAPNGVEIPAQAWADMMGNAAPDNRAFTPAAEEAHKRGELGVVPGPVPPISAAGAPPTEFSVPMPFGSSVGHVTQPTPPPQQFPPMTVEHTSSSSRSGNSFSTEEPYRRTDVQLEPTELRNPALDQQIGDSRSKQMGYVGDQVKALGDQSAALGAAADQRMLAADDLAAQRERDLAERSEFEAVAQEATAMREQRMAQRIAQIPAEDPGKMWQGTEGGLARAAGIMASAIGGLLAVSTGSGRNLGLEALQQTIDRDIASQRANIDSEWRKVAKDENELARFRQQMGDERAWKSEQAAYRYASLATKLEAESAKYDSVAKQAELQGMSASLMAQAGQHYTQSLMFDREYNTKTAEMAFQQRRVVEDMFLETRKVRLAESSAAAKAAGDGATSPVRLGRLPHTREDIYIPPDIAANMDKGEYEKLRNDAASLSTFAGNAQSFITLATDLGRQYDGAGKNARPVTSAQLEAMRGAWTSLQFDEVVKRTGLTATDETTKRIMTILSGTGSPPGGSWTIGSGEMAAFSDYVVRNLEKDSNNFEARGARLAGTDPDTGKPTDRSFTEFAADARKVVDAAGTKTKPLESQDPFDLANSSMVQIAQAKSADDVIGALNTLSTVNAHNSQGDVENLALSGSVNALAKGAQPSGQVTSGIRDADGNLQSMHSLHDSRGQVNADLVAKLKAGAAKAAHDFPKQAVAIGAALQRALEALNPPPAPARDVLNDPTFGRGIR
jgi:hypothetical protein